MKDGIKRLPHIDGTLGWYELASNHDDILGQPLEGEHQFDMVVIGAGFAGISAAQRLLEIHSYLKIAVVDALKVGQGASGRNAGFLIDTPHTLDASADDESYNEMLQNLNIFAINRLKQFTDKYSIDCDWQHTGKYLAAHERRNLKGLQNYRKVLNESGMEYEWLEGDALNQRLGTQYYRAAIYTEDTILMNPASLIRGFAKGAKIEGITIFEDSPITEVEYGYPLHTLYSEKGTIKAPIVINAANGYNMEFQDIENRLIPCFTYGSLTEPISDADYERYFKEVKPWGITSSHAMGSTVRLTPDRRIFMRNKFDYEAKLRSNPATLEKAFKMHRQSFEARFPDIKQLKFDYTWGGMITLTFNSEPMFMDHNNGVYTIVGCNGVGVTRGTYLGYYMANYIHKIESPELKFIQDNSDPSLIPPEPFKTIGAKSRLFWEQKRAGGDV